MTNYEYAGEMQELCFKISQAHKAMEKTGLHDFYLAASNGFAELRKNYTVEEAQAVASEEQMEMLESSKAYVNEVVKQAAEKLDKEIAI